MEFHISVSSASSSASSTPLHAESSPNYSVTSSISYSPNHSVTSSISYQETPPGNSMYSQIKNQVKNLKKQLLKEQESSKAALATEQQRSLTLSLERRQLMVVLSGTKQHHLLAESTLQVQLATMRAELESNRRRSDSAADEGFRTNQNLERKVVRLEAKIEEQEKTIRASEIAECVRKEQKEKKKAAGKQKEKEKKAMEAATGVVTKKRKRKPSSKKQQSSTETK